MYDLKAIVFYGIIFGGVGLVFIQLFFEGVAYRAYKKRKEPLQEKEMWARAKFKHLSSSYSKLYAVHYKRKGRVAFSIFKDMDDKTFCIYELQGFKMRRIFKFEDKQFTFSNKITLPFPVYDENEQQVAEIWLQTFNNKIVWNRKEFVYTYTTGRLLVKRNSKIVAEYNPRTYPGYLAVHDSIYELDDLYPVFILACLAPTSKFYF